MNHIPKFLSIVLTGFLLCACTETQLASHVLKQLPSASSGPHSVGHYKVGNSYKIKGNRYTPKEKFGGSEVGIASWYGPGFHGKTTANGEIFDENQLTAAHRTLQLPSIVRVTNLENGKSLIVRVNDRGPFAHGRIIDLSKKSAELLDFKNNGTAKVRVTVLGEESRIVASMAKRGQSTAGTELALNRTGRIDTRYDTRLAMADVKPQAKPASPYRRPNAEIIQRVASVEQQPVLNPPVQRIAAPQPQIERVALSAPQRPQPVYTAAQRHGIVSPASKPVQVQTAHFPQAKPAQYVQQAVYTPVNKPILYSEVYYVDAGTYASFDNAMTAKLSLNTAHPVAIKTTSISGQSAYNVTVGPLNSAEQANTLSQEMISRGRQASVVASSH